MCKRRWSRFKVHVTFSPIPHPSCSRSSSTSNPIFSWSWRSALAIHRSHACSWKEVMPPISLRFDFWWFLFDITLFRAWIYFNCLLRLKCFLAHAGSRWLVLSLMVHPATASREYRFDYILRCWAESVHVRPGTSFGDFQVFTHSAAQPFNESGHHWGPYHGFNDYIFVTQFMSILNLSCSSSRALQPLTWLTPRTSCFSRPQIFN